MKTKAIFLSILSIFLSFMIVFQSCNKDEETNTPTDNTPPVYTNGEGQIGSAGGTVKIEDASSPINGASIVIPEGALDSNVEIKIVSAPSSIFIEGDEEVILIGFEPEGLTFDEPVQITLPFSGNSNNARAFYYNADESVVSQIPVISTSSGKITATTNHFSYYFATDENFGLGIEMLNIDGKIGARLNYMSFNGEEGFSNIPVGETSNAHDALINSTDRVFSHFHVSLYEDGIFWTNSFKAICKIKLERLEYGGGIRADITLNEQGNAYETEMLSEDEGGTADLWFQGKPLIFYFDDFTPSSSDSYFVKVKWRLTKHSSNIDNYVQKYTDLYELNNKNDDLKLSNMAVFSTNDLYEDCIDENYINGSGNYPPYAPNNESPENGSIDVSVNTNLSWTCNDPDGDELKYDIYFGTSSNPPKVEDDYMATTYNPGTLAENTTYYWEIRAYEVNNENHSSHSNWSFTTGGSGGGNPPELSLQTPGGVQSGNITITYTVTDEDGNNNDFAVFYQEPGSGSNPATIVSSSAGIIDGSTIRNVSPGTHSFVWNSNQDYPNNHTSNMKIKMVWDATLGFETNTFEVDNTGGGNPNLEWISLNGGTFQMGSNDGDSDEQPIHTVTLNSFGITKYEITNGQYCEFLNDIGCSSNGSHNGEEYIDMDDGDCQINYSGGEFVPASGKAYFPVIEVSWYGAHAYAIWAGGRLPTEAEWEFAARGGVSASSTTYAGSNNINDVAWYYGNSGGDTHQVGTKAPNELGIYDMSGNVWEWCNDWYDSDYYSNSPQNNPQGPSSGNYRVLRGGSWGNLVDGCRVANRGRNNPVNTDGFGGFRIAR